MDAKEKKKWLTIGIVYAVVFVLILLIANHTGLNLWLGSILRLLRPVFYGLALAYLTNPFLNFFEQKAFRKVHPKALRRGISLTLAILVLFAFVALLLLLILPQLTESISAFAGNYNTYVDSAIGQFNQLVSRINSVIERVTAVPDFFEQLDLTAITDSVTAIFGTSGETVFNDLASSIGKIGSAIGTAVGYIADWVIGIFFAIYLLAAKEHHYAVFVRLRHGLFNDSVNLRLSQLISTADHSFGGFIKGKIIDSIIIGFLTYIVVVIFRIPYPVLVASFVGITNVIPVIGPIIGAIPTAFIILLAEPGKVIPFLLIIFAIQQLDGNLIGPKILGGNTGVSSLCVMIAITTVGSLWGLAGMLLGVPLFATVLELTDKYLERRLQEKGLPSGVESYYPTDTIVNPAADAHVTTDGAVQKFERRVFRLQERIALHPDTVLTRREQRQLRVYEFAKKHHIFAEVSDEFLVRFAAERAAEIARTEADELYRTLSDKPAEPLPDESAEAETPADPE